MSAAIEFPGEAYVVGIWHFEMPDRLGKFGKGGNYVGILFGEARGGNAWTFSYRIRHYRDTTAIWEHNDEMHSWDLSIRGSEEETRQKTDTAVQVSAAIAGAMVDYTSWFHSDGRLRAR